MKITLIDVQKKNKNRYNIYIDDAFAFGVTEETLATFGLHKGMILTPDQKEQIIADNAFQKVYTKAIVYLSYGLRTEHEVRLKLSERDDYSEDIIDRVIDKLIAERYVDDVYYAKMFIQQATTLTKKGRFAIATALAKKGMSSTMINEALANLGADEELDMAVSVATKYFAKQSLNSHKEAIQKTTLHLVQKGFSFDLAQQAIAALPVDKNPSNEWDSLMYQAKKIYARYRLKYSDKELIQKLKTALYQKGFDSALINRLLKEHLEDLND